MFPHLRRKLILVYTMSTGLILSLVLALAFCFYASSVSRQGEAAFQNQLFTLSSRLQSDSAFSDSELSRMELQHHLLISIEENGHSLFFTGAYFPATSRDILTARAEEAAQEEGISTTSAPISSELTASSLLHIRGDANDSYLASVLVARQESGYKKLVLLSDETGTNTQLLLTGLLYLLIDAAGILLLFLIGRRFVNHALRPAEKSFVKQQEFVSAASHELRSPLAVIRASASAISDSPEHCGRLIDTILKECQRGSSLIKNLLLLASADSQNITIQKVRFEIDELLLNLLELYEPLCRSRGGVLLLELPEEPLPDAYADPDLCRQILTILLDNAVSYGLSGTCTKRILIQPAYVDKSLSVCVSDLGPGLSDTEKGLVFDRFYRADKSRNKKEHFGLGLSIAADLARLQDIRFWLTDTAGGGCTFTLEIPH